MLFLSYLLLLYKSDYSAYNFSSINVLHISVILMSIIMIVASHMINSVNILPMLLLV